MMMVNGWLLMANLNTGLMLVDDGDTSSSNDDGTVVLFFAWLMVVSRLWFTQLSQSDIIGSRIHHVCRCSRGSFGATGREVQRLSFSNRTASLNN